jgi:hypothetical protein
MGEVIQVFKDSNSQLSSLKDIVDKVKDMESHKEGFSGSHPIR